jgi:RND family efflux transporter MFP subunit
MTCLAWSVGDRLVSMMRSYSMPSIVVSVRPLAGFRRVVGAALGTTLASVLIACGGGGSGRTGPPPIPPTLVRLEVVHDLPIDDVSEYVSTIQSLSSTSIKPEVSGAVTKILVRSGDRVTLGMPLFQIDPSRQEASVTSQDAARAAQEAAATFSRQQLERARTLFAAGAISKLELDQAQANDDAAQSQLKSLNARLQQERVTLQYYEVRSPAAGTVGDVPIRVGTHVTSDTILTTVDQNQALEVYVPVPLERSRDLKLGLPIHLVDGQGATLGDTTISFISPRVDDQTQSVLVKGRLTGNGMLRSAQFVRARIVWRTSRALAIPILAVTRINGQPFVFVVQEKDGHLSATQRLVGLGPLVGNGNDVVVLNGLAAGERIVVSGVQKLGNGAPIRVS